MKQWSREKVQAIAASGLSLSASAKQAGISVSSLQRLIERYGIERPRVESQRLHGNDAWKALGR